MRGHLQCRDTLAGNEGCPLKTGTTVVSNKCLFRIFFNILFPVTYPGVCDCCHVVVHDNVD